MVVCRKTEHRQTDTVHLEKLDALAWRCAGRLTEDLTDNNTSHGEVKETKQTEQVAISKGNLKVNLGSGEHLLPLQRT